MIKNAIPKISAPKKQPFTVFIEGNIGAGKTTFLNHFRKHEDVCLHTEPVEKWRNVQGINLLVSVFIQNNIRYACDQISKGNFSIFFFFNFNNAQ